MQQFSDCIVRQLHVLQAVYLHSSALLPRRYPFLQEHSNDPPLFVHICSQPSVFATHSSTSVKGANIIYSSSHLHCRQIETIERAIIYVATNLQSTTCLHYAALHTASSHYSTYHHSSSHHCQDGTHIYRNTERSHQCLCIPAHSHLCSLHIHQHL